MLSPNRNKRVTFNTFQQDCTTSPCIQKAIDKLTSKQGLSVQASVLSQLSDVLLL